MSIRLITICAVTAWTERNSFTFPGATNAGDNFDAFSVFSDFRLNKRREINRRLGEVMARLG
jgi:hypothetical protein